MVLEDTPGPLGFPGAQSSSEYQMAEAPPCDTIEPSLIMRQGPPFPPIPSLTNLSLDGFLEPLEPATDQVASPEIISLESASSQAMSLGSTSSQAISLEHATDQVASPEIISLGSASPEVISLGSASSQAISLESASPESGPSESDLQETRQLTTTVRARRGEKRRAPDEIDPQRRQAYLDAAREFLKEDDPLPHGTKYLAQLRQLIDWLISDKDLPEEAFQLLTCSLNPHERMTMRFWETSLNPNRRKMWTFWHYPDCRGRPIDDEECVRGKYSLLPKAKLPKPRRLRRFGKFAKPVQETFHCPKGNVHILQQHKDCHRHRVRLDQPEDEEKTLWCLLVWPECDQDPLGGPCCKVIPCAPSDMPLIGIRLWALAGPCDEHMQLSGHDCDHDCSDRSKWQHGDPEDDRLADEPPPCTRGWR
ncbi:hypothetical protein AYO22_11697 [Fonsecaea multimorphosa]|nr:hypothetical protein AYO22_11697 [Fonsecaea multimorphosa]